MRAYGIYLLPHVESPQTNVDNKNKLQTDLDQTQYFYSKLAMKYIAFYFPSDLGRKGLGFLRK